MAKVYLAYGYSEGKWHSKRLRRALKRRGYNIERSLKHADVVIGHSGGCYDIPALRDKQLLMLINPPYWPERSIAERVTTITWQLIRAIRPGNHPIYHAKKLWWHCIYFVIRRRHNHRIADRTITFDLATEVNHSRTILVRNNDDPWLTPDLGKLQTLHPHLQIKRLPGDHDDCWRHPDRYIDLIEAYPS